jgi:fatty acid desaturase
MEYHIEHHMFPTVPSYNLPKLHKLLKNQMPQAKKGLWGAYKEIIPALIRQSKDPNYKLEVLVPNP